MNEEETLIRAVLAAPRDPSPRLVYADWLEERGDLRAEYLRTLYELDSRAATDEGVGELRSRMQKLQAGIDPLWVALMNRGRIAASSGRTDGGSSRSRQGRRHRRARREAD